MRCECVQVHAAGGRGGGPVPALAAALALLAPFMQLRACSAFILLLSFAIFESALLRWWSGVCGARVGHADRGARAAVLPGHTSSLDGRRGSRS